MNKYLVNIIFIISLIFFNNAYSKENIMILKLKDGDVKIEMFPDVAPNHVKRITELANNGKYDNEEYECDMNANGKRFCDKNHPNHNMIIF